MTPPTTRTASPSRVLRVGRYVLLDTIGEGAFGRVKLAVNEDTGAEYAVKILAKSDIIAHDLTLQVRREIAVMKALKHRSIVRLIEVLTSAKHLYIVIELVTGGELFDLVANHGCLPEHIARRYFHQLVDAVAYCHSRRVYHRDLKPENLLLSEDGSTLKITDFGLSSIKRADTSDELLHTVTGSPHYIPPEVISDASNGYEGDKADAWAVGMILYGMLAGFLPFDDTSTTSLYRKILHEQVEYPSHFSDSAIQLLEELFRKDPKQRANMERVREFEWFRVDYQPKLNEDSTSARRRRKRSGSSSIRRHRRQNVTDGSGERNEARILRHSGGVGDSNDTIRSAVQSQSHDEKRQSIPSDKQTDAGLAQSQNDVIGPVRPTTLRATTTIMPILGKSRQGSLPVSTVPRRPNAVLHTQSEQEEEETEEEDGADEADDEDSVRVTVPVKRVDSEPSLRAQAKRRGDKLGGTGSAIAAAFRRQFRKRTHHQQNRATSPEGGATSGTTSEVSPLQVDRTAGFSGLDEISGSGSRSMNLLSKARGFASARSTRASRKSMGWEPETPPSQSLTSFPPQPANAFHQHTSPISPDLPSSMPTTVFNVLRDGTDDRSRAKTNRFIPRVSSRRSELRSSNTTMQSTPRASFDSSLLSTPLFVTSRGSTEYGTPEPRSTHSARYSTGSMQQQLSLNGHRRLLASSSSRGTPVQLRQSATLSRQATPQLTISMQKTLEWDQRGQSAKLTHETVRWDTAAAVDDKRMLTTNELSMEELPRTSYSVAAAKETMPARPSHIFKPTTLQLVSEKRVKREPPHPLCPTSLRVDVEYPVWGIDEFEVFNDTDAPTPTRVQSKPRPQNMTSPRTATAPPQKPAAPAKRTIFAPLNSTLIHKLSMTTREVPLEKTHTRALNQ